MLLRFATWKVTLIVGALLLGGFLCIPNLFSDEFRASHKGWFWTGPVKLGLDLQGGASINLEVDPNELRTNKIKALSGDIRAALLTQPAIRADRDASSGEFVLVKVRDPSKLDEARARIQKLGAPRMGQVGGANSLSIAQRGADTLAVSMTREALDKLGAEAVTNSLEAVRRRIDASGLVEPNIQRQGASRILVEVPGLNDVETQNLVDVITKSGVLTFQMVDETASAADFTLGEARNGRVLLPSQEGQPLVLFEDPVITGLDLSNAQQAYDQSNRPNISFSLRPVGAQKFGKATKENVGKRFAIVLDNTIVSAPVINSPIMTGSGQIEGNFTIQSAENLAVILRSGALPAKLQVVEKRVVGAGLGADSIRMGVTATVVGVLAVTVFMILAYGLLGIFAIIALYLNLMCLMGVLSGFGATLTLPGIAGILLTMGMAVDANVLIFERIREEQRNGRSPISAVESGYEHAMATILDANATHFIAGVVMFFLGSGPIRGFALTLAIGIVTSLFTSVWVARWIMSLWMRAAKPKWVPV